MYPANGKETEILQHRVKWWGSDIRVLEILCLILKVAWLIIWINKDMFPTKIISFHASDECWGDGKSGWPAWMATRQTSLKKKQL